MIFGNIVIDAKRLPRTFWSEALFLLMLYIWIISNYHELGYCISSKNKFVFFYIWVYESSQGSMTRWQWQKFKWNYNKYKFLYFQNFQVYFLFRFIHSFSMSSFTRNSKSKNYVLRIIRTYPYLIEIHNDPRFRINKRSKY